MNPIVTLTVAEMSGETPLELGKIEIELRPDKAP